MPRQSIGSSVGNPAESIGPTPAGEPPEPEPATPPASMLGAPLTASPPPVLSLRCSSTLPPHPNPSMTTASHGVRCVAHLIMLSDPSPTFHSRHPRTKSAEEGRR